MLDSTSQNNNISSERLKFNNIFRNFNESIDKTSLFTFLKTLFRELVTYPFRVLIQQPKYLKDFQNRINHIKIEQTDNLATLERKKTIIEQSLVIKELLEKKGLIQKFNSTDKQKVQNLHQLLDSFNTIINYLSPKKEFTNESSPLPSAEVPNPNPSLTSITDNADDNSTNGDEVSADADDTSSQEPVVAPSDIEPPKLSESHKIEEIKHSQVPENIISPSSDPKQVVSNMEPETHWFKAGIITALAGGMFAINKFSSNFIHPTTVLQAPQEPSFILGVNLTEIVNEAVPATKQLLSTLSSQVCNISNTFPIANPLAQDFFRVTQNLTNYVAQNLTTDVVQNFTTQLQEVIVSQTDRIPQNQSEITSDESTSGQSPNAYLLSLGAIALAALSAHFLWQAYKRRAANASAPQAPQNPEPTISNNNTNVGGTDPNLPNGTSPVSEPSGDPVGGEPTSNGTLPVSEPSGDPVGEPASNGTLPPNAKFSDPVGSEPAGNETLAASEPSDPVGEPTINVTQPPFKKLGKLAGNGSATPSEPVEGKPTDNVTQSGSETPSDPLGGEAMGKGTQPASEPLSDPIGSAPAGNETLPASEPSSKPVEGKPADNVTQPGSETPSDPVGIETTINVTQPPFKKLGKLAGKGTRPSSAISSDPVEGKPTDNMTKAGSETPSEPVEGKPTDNMTKAGSETPSEPVEGKPTDNVTQPGSETPSDPVEGKPTDNVTQPGSETPSDPVEGKPTDSVTQPGSGTPSDPVGNGTIDNETEPKVEASDLSLHQAFIEFPKENNQIESKQGLSNNETKAESETPSDPVGNETIDNETEPKIEASDPSLHQAFIEFPNENNQTESKQEQSIEAQKQASSNSQPIERVMDENEIASFFSSVKNNPSSLVSGTNLGSANTNEPPSEVKTGESNSLNNSFFDFDEPQENATTTAQKIYNVAGQVIGGVTGALSGVNQAVGPYLTSPEAEEWKLHRYTTAIQMLRLLIDEPMQSILKDLERYFKFEPMYKKFDILRKILVSNPDKLDSRKQYQAFVVQTREVLLELEKNNHGIPKYLEDKIHIMNAKWFTKNTLGTFFTKMVFYVGTLKLDNKEQIIEHFDKLPLSEKMEILLEGIDKVPSKAYIAHQTAKLGTILNGFDPLKYSNMPSQWSKCTYENKKGETLTKIHMRTGMPTGPQKGKGWFANLNPFSSPAIRLVPEYLSFWRGLKAQNKKLLVILRLDPKYFDVQNGEMKKDRIKLTQVQLYRQGLWIKMINDAAKSEEFKDTVKVAVLPIDGEWIERDIQHFKGEQSKEQFLSKLEADILNPENGFLFPPPLESQEAKENFVKDTIKQVANSPYFSKIEIFNSGTMTAFVSLLQSQLSEALHFLTEADVIQENCKDAIDRTAAIKGAQLLEMLCRLGRLADKALHDIIIGTILGPALAVLKRALLKGRRPILLETIKFLEQNANTDSNYHPALPGGYKLIDVSLKTDDWQTLFKKDLEIEDLTKALHKDRRFLQIIKNQEEDFSKLISKPTNAKVAQAKRASGVYYDLFKNLPELHNDKSFRQGFISSIIKSTTSEVINDEIKNFKTERSEDFKRIKNRRLSLLKSTMSEKSQKVTEKKEKGIKALKN